MRTLALGEPIIGRPAVLTVLGIFRSTAHWASRLCLRRRFDPCWAISSTDSLWLRKTSMSSSKGLGRGLDALFGGSAPKAEQEPGHETATNTVPVTALRANPNQPRRHFDEAALRELAESIKSQGIIQPLLVRPLQEENTYQIVAGERRWRAAQMAGLKSVPVFVRQLTDKEVMAAALIENLQREDLNPIEEAEALQALREALELTQEELASRLGKSRPAIANALRLLQLSANARADIQAGRLSAGHARCLLGIDDMHAHSIARPINKAVFL